VLAIGIAVTLAGMAWLSRVQADSSYVAAVGLPMVLIGTGQGLAFAPLTAAGITGVTAGEAGAASGLVNTAHQLGSSLGLGILVTLASQTTTDAPDSVAAVADHVSAALTGSTAFLALAVLITALFVARGRADGGDRALART